VIAEKPLCSSLEELEAIRKAVEKNTEVHLSMLLVMRFYPCYRMVKQIVDNDEIGDVLLGSAQKSYRMYYPLPDGGFRGRPGWMKSRSTFAGIIPYVGIHVTDLLWWASGREFVETMAYHGNLAHPDMGEMEDTASVLYQMDNGGSSVVRIDYHRPMTAPSHGDDRLRLAGSKGIVEVVESKVSLMTKDKEPHEVELPGPKPFFKNFVEGMRGEDEHLITKEEVIRITEICLKARESADKKKPVKLK
jgi:predicted dehydrogenase